jgi:heat shock protein HtpX
MTNFKAVNQLFPGGFSMNYFKTFLLMMLLMTFALLVGYFVGGQSGMVIAFVIAALSNFFMYFFSADMVLAGNRARAVTPGEAPELYSVVEELTQKAGLPMPKLYIMEDDSPNAFATGRDPEHAAVCVTSGILQTLNRNQLKAVLGHELTHVKNRDILTMSVAATFAGAVMMLCNLFYFFGGRRDDREGNPIAMLAVMLIAPLAASLIQLAISRSREFGADQGGAQLTTPDQMISALKGIHRGIEATPTQVSESSAHLFIESPFSGRNLSSLFMTHPPIEDRIAALEAMKR